jgi:hypothetical protein
MHPFRSTTFPAACQQSIEHDLLDGCSTSQFYPWAGRRTFSGGLAGSICQTVADRVSVRSMSGIEPSLTSKRICEELSTQDGAARAV